MHFTVRPFALAAGVLLACSGCDAYSSGYRAPEAGDAVEILAEAPDRPASREGYAGSAAYVATDRLVVLLDPGTGASDPPRMRRAFRLPWGTALAAQVDADGFVWLAVPSVRTSIESASYDRIVVVDPHTARVVRTVALPRGQYGVHDVAVTRTHVVVAPWTSSQPARLVAVEAACASDASRCSTRVFADLGVATTSGYDALRTSGDTLFALFGTYLSDAPPHLTAWRLSTGERLASVDTLSPYTVVSDDALHDIRWLGGRREIARVDRSTWRTTARATASGDLSSTGRIARVGAHLYEAEGSALIVRDAAMLTVVERIETSIETTDVFGPVAPGVLLLNGQTAWDVGGRRRLDGVAPALGSDERALRLGVR